MIDFSFNDDLDLISLDDENYQNDGELDLIDLDFSKPESKKEEILPLYSREMNGKTELTSYPEQFEQEQPLEEMNFQPVHQEENQSELPIEQNQEFPFEGENDLEREIERNMAQQTSRQIESIAGMPGDINSIVEGITGLPVFGLLGKFLPTSGKLKETSEEVTKGYTKPKNEFEEKVGELQQDIASFMIPGSKQYSMLRNIGIPLTANLAKEGIKLTGKDKLAEGTKMGLMVMLDLMSQRQGGAKKFYEGLFKNMHERVPKGKSFSTKNLEPDLQSLLKEFEKGGDKPSTTKAIAKIKEIQGKIKNGKIDLDEAVATRPAINEMIEDMQGFEYIFKPKLKEKIINNLHRVKGEVIKSVEEYGKNFDPELLKLSREANEAAAAFHQSNKISEFLNKKFGAKALAKPVKFLLGIGAPGLSLSLGGVQATAVAALPLAATYQTVKMISRLKNSATLRKYYASVLDAAAKGNVGQASRGIKAMEKELQDDDFIEFED